MSTSNAENNDDTNLQRTMELQDKENLEMKKGSHSRTQLMLKDISLKHLSTTCVGTGAFMLIAVMIVIVPSIYLPKSYHTWTKSVDKTMVQVGETFTGMASGDWMGFSISLSRKGKRIAIGSQGHDQPNGYSSGLAQVFEIQRGNWTQLGSNIYGEGEYNRLGYDVSLSGDGDWLAISDDRENTKICQYSTGDWVQQGSMIKGKYVSLSENAQRVATGANGVVRVYEYDDDANDWIQIGKVNTTDLASVAISGNATRMVVGEPWNNEKHENGGRVRVFEFNLTVKQWYMVGQALYGPKNHVYFGGSVSISQDSESIVVGTGRGNFVKVFRYGSDSKEWEQQGDDIFGNEQDELFGSSVSMSHNGDHIIVGSPYYDNRRGKATVYQFDQKLWTKIDDIQGMEDGDEEGDDVSMSHDSNFVAVGASWASSNNFWGNGHVRIFQIIEE